MKTAGHKARFAAVTEQDPRWTSIVTRDAGADASFYYAVTTTGVYCRPTCAARRPRPEHVRLFVTAQEAQEAGFRPCKRCKPDQGVALEPHRGMIEKVCRLIETSIELPCLDQLAEHAGLSPSHFHRLFKATMGLTPKEYAVAHRASRLRKTLQQSCTVTEAMYEAGYNSNGRFYETSQDVLGMSPATYRAGGENIEIQFAVAECSLGFILVARSKRGVCAILFGDDAPQLIEDLHRIFPRGKLIGGDASFRHLLSTVVDFVEKPTHGLDLPLDIQGTAFQQRVWKILQTIPMGSTVSYAEVARRIGVPKASRAVAQACGANILAVAVPCHRVVKQDGTLSGYRWGVKRKGDLLEREAHS
ncbi:MAG: bifunctional DNA-binding transcriptional regulator/O6-methylguanine-DNA methyltransferase Ada [Nitrospirales bacterium]